MQNTNYLNNILLNSQNPQFNNVPVNYSNLYNSYQGFNNVAQPTIQQQTNQVTGQPSQAVLNAVSNMPINQTLAQQVKSGLTEWSPFQFEGHPILTGLANIPTNALHDILEIGTGLTHMVTHPKEIGQQIGDYYTQMAYNPELQNPLSRAGRSLRDMYNLVYGDVTGLTSQNLNKVIQSLASGDTNQLKQSASEVGSEVWDKITKDPFIVSSVVAPNLTARTVSKGATGALNLAEKAGVPVGETARKVANAMEVVEAKFGNQKAELNQLGRELSKASNRDLELVIDNVKSNTPLPKNLNDLKDKFIKFNEKYQDIYQDNALVNPREIAALQYVQGKTGLTMQDVRRTLAPHLEQLTEGVNDPYLTFKNRVDSFNHELNSLRKDGQLKKFNQDAKVASLTGEDAEFFNKHFNPNERAVFTSTDMTVKEAVQYLKDLQRDAWTGSKYIGKAAQDMKYQENLSRLAGLAESTGDPMLKHLYDGMKLADAGDIRPFTMADANIPEGLKVSDEGRRFAGKSSSREYGTATTPEIAKAYKNIHGFIDDTVRNRVREEITNNILHNGTIDGVTSLVGENINPSSIRYINPENLANGSLSDAINTAGTVAHEGYIPIDVYNLNAIKSLLKPASSPFGNSPLSDLYNTAKEAFLSSGLYLGGNAISGAFGTTINSGSFSNLVRDAISATASKGQLAKELGLYRELGTDTRKFSTPLGKGVHKINRIAGGGLFPTADAWMQNKFAEINAQANLRRMGIPFEDRAKAISNMDKIQLAKVIDNVKYSSMMNSKYRIFPRGQVRDYLGIANPFLDWTDTATQVTAKMYRDHPILMGMAAADLFGNIGIDKELQNRLGLRVYSDKPLVTYKGDDKSPNGAKEVRLSFLPQLTPLEFFSDPSRMLAGNGAPALTAIYEAFKGKNPYGNLMRRSYAQGSYPTMIQGSKRYRQNPETGRIEEINKAQADEVLSTAIRSISGVPSLVNKTVMPIGAEIYNRLTGSDLQYHMPYGQSILGSFSTGQPELGGGINRTMLMSGDPSKPRTIKDVVKGLGTYFESDYYPENQLTGSQIRRLRKSGARRIRRDYGE